MTATLRLTDTNNATDSSGRTWGLDGNLVWWLIGGLGTSITVFFGLLVGLRTPLLPAIGVAVVPGLAVLSYLLLLRHGKPPGYDRDLFESLLMGPGFGPETDPARLPRHPMHLPPTR